MSHEEQNMGISLERVGSLFTRVYMKRTLQDLEFHRLVFGFPICVIPGTVRPRKWEQYLYRKKNTMKIK